MEIHESTWWRFTTNHKTGFTDEMRMTITCDRIYCAALMQYTQELWPKSHGDPCVFYGWGEGRESKRETFLTVVVSFCHLGPITLDSISVWSCFPLLFSSLFKSVWGLSCLVLHADLLLLGALWPCPHYVNDLVLWPLHDVFVCAVSRRLVWKWPLQKGYICVQRFPSASCKNTQSHTFELFTRGFQPIYLNELSQRHNLGYLQLNMSMDRIC